MSGRGLTWYKRDPIRFIDGVQGMGPEVIGAYAVLIDLIYARGGEIRRDDRHLSGVLGCSVRKARALTDALIEAEKIIVRGEKLTQKVAETSVKQARTEREARANAQRKRRETEAGLKENNALDDKPKCTKPPREEKIREEKKETNVSLSKTRKSRISEDAVISGAMERAGETRGHSREETQAQFEKFKNDAIAKGKLFVSWDRAFVTWLDSEFFRPITTQPARRETGNEHARRIAAIATGGMGGGPGEDLDPPLPATRSIGRR